MTILFASATSSILGIGLSGSAIFISITGLHAAFGGDWAITGTLIIAETSRLWLTHSLMSDWRRIALAAKLPMMLAIAIIMLLNLTGTFSRLN